jgi:hypothetical protein
MLIVIQRGIIMRLLSLLSALFLALAAFAPSSKAATVTYDVTFSASGSQFHSLLGGSSPVSAASGSFQITFDPSLHYNNNTMVISDFVINLAGLSGHGVVEPVSFNYTPNFLIFGPSGTISGNGFSLGFTLGGLVSDISFSAKKNGHTRTWTALFPQTTLSRVAAPAATPIPASLMMMLTGLLGLGGVGFLRGRRSQTTAALLAA